MVDSFSRPGVRFLARWPSARATRAARQRICELTDRRLLFMPGRRYRDQPEPVSDRLGRLLSPRQLHRPVPQGLPLHGRRAGAVARQAPQVVTPARLWPPDVAPAAVPRPATTRRMPPPRRRAGGQVKDVGEPCEGEPHARFDVAAGGTRTLSRPRRASPAPPADPTCRTEGTSG
jgi:hypothetical protein